ncbi:ubiquitin-like isoform X1 [Tanacetum coccineum]
MQWFRETIFRGNRTFADCEIKNGDTLYCDFEVKGKSIKSMDILPVSNEMVKISTMMLNGKTLNMEVNTSVTMSWIKPIIEAKEGLPPNQYMLFLKGK